MADKWSKLSIYDVDFKLTDEDGEEHSFTFKPLPWADFPKAYDVFGKLERSGLFDADGDDDEAFARQFFEKIDSALITELASVCKVMVSNSYTHLDDKVIEPFVMANVFQLIEPLSKIITKQSKDKRKTDQALSK